MTKYKLLWQALSKIEKGSILIELPNNEQKKNIKVLKMALIVILLSMILVQLTK